MPFAEVVASKPGCKALGTASAAVAASFGYLEGERIPFDLVPDMTAQIVIVTGLPDSAELEACCGDVSSMPRLMTWFNSLSDHRLDGQMDVAVRAQVPLPIAQPSLVLMS